MRGCLGGSDNEEGAPEDAPGPPFGRSGPLLAAAYAPAGGSAGYRTGVLTLAAHAAATVSKSDSKKEPHSSRSLARPRRMRLFAVPSGTWERWAI